VKTYQNPFFKETILSFCGNIKLQYIFVQRLDVETTFCEILYPLRGYQYFHHFKKLQQSLQKFCYEIVKEVQYPFLNETIKKG